MNYRALSALLVLLVACSKAQEPPAGQPQAPRVEAPVRTDRTQYQLQEGPYGPETVIVTTFKAPADKPVYLANCNGAITTGLQRLEGETWVHAWAAETNGCLSQPIIIPAGEQRTETITVASGTDAVVDSRKTETSIGNGTYRSVWYNMFTSFDMNARPWGEELPLDQRVSAPFVIEAAPVRDPSRPSPAERPAEITFIEPAHGAVVAANAPIRVRFFFTPTGFRLVSPPHLYVDRQWIEDVRAVGTESRPPTSMELEYLPKKKWSPGRHEVRVIYQDEGPKTSWYGWSFTVNAGSR